ncbi:AfsR/SARP family transcriptional regulator [Dactylosporangium vinaceum]|uniref:BTAD domain-containing putative transcriptional regulator n=1 Tax=Dactylosporangium vinaceum TaxID=53362 RepID=A0ABV5MTV3_9ACTN|nr:AfsR/SARP family transcriptional regulator [Dactylosporangium vinaceum]UAB97671.1 AfsR/SARP family transcriptional regulator [Dactylosporangium vinaceum]
MRYEILGPLRVVDAKGVTTISAPKIEVLLAALLIRADHLVAAEHLIGEIWGDQPPRRATAGLHVYISELRKFLTRTDRPEGRIQTRPPGYVLELRGDQTDVQEFLSLVDEGRSRLREHRLDEAMAALERALGLWRGAPLGDLLKGPSVEAFATWLSEVRMEATELLMDAQLQLGMHRQLVSRLFLLTAEHPLRESFYKQLMLALYRSDRTADALKVFQTARRTLHAELGLEPCRALQEVQRAILTADDRVLRDLVVTE